MGDNLAELAAANSSLSNLHGAEITKLSGIVRNVPISQKFENFEICSSALALSINWHGRPQTRFSLKLSEVLRCRVIEFWMIC
ncbi:unnamed protein product [Gongylonema pulchrum]|uniref:Uncharacterized protein n=1 Tax=Gongylonema pulchrum TaxID=637853 RepID=A0A183D0D9_9BILA|nr:unnamed protein product [Gongylonema pulchrum]